MDFQRFRHVILFKVDDVYFMYEYINSVVKYKRV